MYMTATQTHMEESERDSEQQRLNAELVPERPIGQKLSNKIKYTFLTVFDFIQTLGLIH